MAFAVVGQSIPRDEGPAKVTGAARYAAEMPADGLLYGVVVNSTITRGRIVSFDTGAALAQPGVVDVITFQNRPMHRAASIPPVIPPQLTRSGL